MLAAAPEKARWTALCDALSTLLPWVDGHEARLLAPALVLLLHLWACWGGGFAAAPTRECVSEGCADQWEVTTVGLNTAADEALLAAVGAAVEVLVAGVKGLADAAGVQELCDYACVILYACMQKFCPARDDVRAQHVRT